MRKVFVIAGNTLMRTARDKKALALLLLMPMILITILGNSLKGMLSGGSIDPIKTLVVNEDKAATPPLSPGAPAAAAAALKPLDFGQILVKDVLTDEKVKKVIDAKTVTDLEQAKADVRATKAIAVIHVPANFTAEILAGKKPTVAVFTDSGKPTQAEIVKQVVQSFTEQVTSGVMSSAAGVSLDQITAAKVKEVAAGTREVSAMQYYAAAMAVMFMVMTAMSQAKGIADERIQGTMNRMLISPTSQGIVLAGQVIGILLVALAQFLVLAAGTRLIFGVYWGNWLQVVGLGTAFAIAAAGLGAAAAGIIREPKGLDAAFGVVPQIFTAMSGGMFPLYEFPDAMKTAAKAVPNYWAMQGFLDLMAGVGNSAQTFWLPVLILLTIGLVTGALGTWRLASR